MGELSRRVLLAGAVGAAASVAAGCARQSPISPAPVANPTRTPTRTPTPSRVPVPPADSRPRWPLTGALLTNPAEARHAAVAVKVPDTILEHPQVGVADADLVFVELDGYRDDAGNSGTRLVAVFHSTMPDAVGPVRSMRPVDVPLLAPMDAVIGHTGGAGGVVDYVAGFEEFLVSELSYMDTRGTGSYSIDGSRLYRQYGKLHYDRAVLCHPAVLAAQTTRFTDGPPEPYLPFAASEAEVSTLAGRAASGVRIPWGSRDENVITYAFDEASGRYLRGMPWGPHVQSDGNPVGADNVLVVQAGQSYAMVGGTGGEEPWHDLINASGPFTYLHGGRAVTGTWTKAREQDPFAFTVAGGAALKVAPGRTWIELPALDADVTLS